MTVVDTTTGEITDTASPEDARRLTDKIKVGVECVWHLIEEAYTSRAWAALGYKSWDDYCTREFGTSRLRLPRENRPEVVASLRESGLSIRAIASATGTGTRQVQEALSEQVWSKNTPAPMNSQDGEASTVGTSSDGSDERGATNDSAPRPAITGTDGKTYPASQPNRARPRQAAETSLNTIESLANRAARETQKLTTDQIRRVKPNAAEWIDGIRNSVEVLQDLIRSLEEN